MEFLELSLAVFATLEAILFAIFGVFYSVYTQYMVSIPNKHLTPAPICELLEQLLWMLTAMVFFTGICAMCTLWEIYKLDKMSHSWVGVGMALIFLMLCIIALRISLTMPIKFKRTTG